MVTGICDPSKSRARHHHFKKLFPIIHKIFETKSSDIARCGKVSISNFQEFLPSIEKISFFAGTLGTSFEF